MSDPTTNDLKIRIIDDLDPQTTAMLQALYSRSPKGVDEHLNDVAERGASAFMERYYVGYGHQSIGDCGTTTIFFENCSILAAKAIQDWLLYNGQEASTRYMDMTTRPIVTPMNDSVLRAIQYQWMALYNRAIEVLVPALKLQYPIEDGQSQTVYDKAINARAFDIARGFLPAGVTTFVSWHTPLRTAYDHLLELMYHPLQEVKELSRMALAELKQRYPASFSHEVNDDIHEYTARSQQAFAYSTRELPLYLPDDFFAFADDQIQHLGIPISEQLPFHNLLTNRPKRSMLHRMFNQFGTIEVRCELDFGSFRDLQRHRSALQSMPLLTPVTFSKWYIDQLAIVPQFQQQAIDKINNIQTQLEEVTAMLDPMEVQYGVAMGYIVWCEMKCPLPSAVYIAELRSSQTVHPTLRKVAQRLGQRLQEWIPKLQLYVDYEEDTWTIRRGKADIIDTQAQQA